MPFAKITRPIIAPSKPRGLLNCIPKMCKKHSEIEVPERLPDDFLSRDIVLLLSVKSIRSRPAQDANLHDRLRGHSGEGLFGKRVQDLIGECRQEERTDMLLEPTNRADLGQCKQGRIGHRPDQIGDGRGKPAQWSHDPLTLRKVARVAHQDGDDGPALQGLRDDRCGRRSHEHGLRGELIGCRRRVTCIALQDAFGLRRFIEDCASQHGASGVQVDFKGGSDTEVAAPAAQPPEQFGVRTLAGAQNLSHSGDQLDRPQVVDGQAMLAHHPPVPPPSIRPPTPTEAISPEVSARP